MVGCCVSGCKSRSELKLADLTFHSFPSDPVLKNKWVQATGKINWEPTKYSKMCSLHFKDNAFTIKFKNKRINQNALPEKEIHITPSTSQESCQPAKADSTKRTIRHLECTKTSVYKKQRLISPSTSQDTSQSASTVKQELPDSSVSKEEERLL